ncbi:MAG TPA: hypothetical protein PKN48_00565 [Bacteroidales bacterium]|nr:hypothetical protein [Bacteroidales bacterium]
MATHPDKFKKESGENFKETSTTGSLVAVIKSNDTIATKSGGTTGYGYDANNVSFFKLRKVNPNVVVSIEDSFYRRLPKKYTGYYFARGTSYSAINIALIEKITDADLDLLKIISTFFDLYLNANVLSKIVRNLGPSRKFKNVKAFIVALRAVILELGNELFEPDRYQCYSENRAAFSSFFKLLFPTAKYSFLQNDSLLKVTSAMGKNYALCCITDVVEVNNIRYSLSTFMHDPGRPSIGSSYFGTHFFIKAVNHENRCYDYIDVGRFFTSIYISDMSLLGIIAYADATPVFPTKEVIDDLTKITPETALPLIVTNTDIGIIIKRYQQKMERQQSERKDQEELNKKLEARLEHVKLPDKFLNINGIVFKKSGITYEKQLLTISSPDIDENWVYNILTTVARYINIDTVTFDSVFATFLKDVVKKVEKRDESAEGTIGDVSFKVVRSKIKSSTGAMNTLTYINDIRINFEEVYECLERALCFTTQKDYNYFLSEVSKCSLKIHKYLQRGVSMNVRDEFNDCTINMKLPLVRSKNINYLVIEGNKFKVRDTHKIIELHNSRDLVDVLNVFMNPKVLDGVGFDQIRALVDAAAKEFITAVEKSQKLLKDTEERFKISVGDHRVDTGHTYHGYLIKGKLDTYILEVDVDNPEKKNGVYRYPSGQYVCIVDKSAAQVGMDKVVNRVYALHNDSMLANQIHTLR